LWLGALNTNLAFGPKSGFKINAGVGLQTKARLQLWFLRLGLHLVLHTQTAAEEIALRKAFRQTGIELNDEGEATRNERCAEL